MNAQIKVSESGPKKISDVSTDVGEGLGNANNFSRLVQWPNYHLSGQALIRIQFIGLDQNDINSISITADPIDPIFNELKKIEGLNEYWVFIPITNKWIEVKHKKLGAARIYLPEDMKDKDTYLVEAGINRVVDIKVEPLTDYNRSIRVELDEYEIKETPAVFNNVVEGNHTLTFRIGSDKISRNIEVTGLNNRFSGVSDSCFDFRNKKKIKIVSLDKDASIYVDDKLQTSKSIFETDLTYGTHTVAAKLPNGQIESRIIDVKDETLSVIYLDPVGLKDFEVIGIYGSKRVSAPVYVNGLPQEYRPIDMDKSQTSHTFRLPIGSDYTFRMNYMGSSGQKRINVTSDMSPTQEIVIRGRKEFRWPWDIEMSEKFYGVTVAYVMKQLVTTGEGICIKTNGVWNASWNKWLRGIQVGLNVQPQTDWGLGLYSGFFLDTFFSKSDEGYEGFQKTLDEYLEWDIYMPLHIWYQVPFAEEFAIAVHGGFSFSYSLYGEFNSSFWNTFTDAVGKAFRQSQTGDYGYDYDYDESSEESWTEFWGETGFPKRFNAMADIGLKLRLENITLGIQWSKGLNDHKTFSEYGNVKTVQNRRTFSIAINF